MTITWKIASRTDLHVLLELMREFCAADAHPFDPQAAARALSELLANPSLGRAWLIEAGGVAGYAVLSYGFSVEFGGREAFVDELYVRPAFQGHGLATETLAFVEREARTAGARTLHVEVRSANDRARQGYERAGFELRDWQVLSKKL